MSRNKENIPLSLSQRVNGSIRSPSKNLYGDEFFTDSLLDVTRASSRIPSPSPQKVRLAKPRRARTTKLTRNAQPSTHQAPAPGTVDLQSQQRDLRPSTPQENSASVPKLRTQSLSTPPGANDELPSPSLYSSISSPPPQDITDAYQQIQDEEDLAQTEQELSSDESNKNDVAPARPVRLHKRSHSETKIRPAARFTQSLAASTPTRSTGTMNAHHTIGDQVETLSEASGLSFLNNMTDRSLADALTPHMSERAKDRARLKEVWDQKQPRAFSMAKYPINEKIIGASQVLEPKRPAFSQASRALPSRLPTWNEIQSRKHTFDLQHFDEESLRSNDSPLPTRHQPPKVLPTNPNIERNFNFTRNHGFPRNRPALTEKNLEQQNRGSSIPTQPLQSHSSVPSLQSDQSTNNARVLDDVTRARNGASSRLPLFQRSLQAENNRKPQEPSQIDWAAAAAEIPIPSVEISNASDAKGVSPVSVSKFISPDKSRRWDNDFTGQSFQVSESPPVRAKQVGTEQRRDKEIEGLTKQAVTTSRLSEIRERHSEENLRSTSKSPASRSASRSIESKFRPSTIDENDSEVIGVVVPDTPVVIYRSSSNSGSDSISKTPAQEYPNADRQQSHDQLQRLARAMSSTPRSSPSSGSGSKDREGNKSSTAIDKEGNALQARAQISDKVLEKPATHPSIVAETPRVSGAWTDTILPDTVKPTKQTDKNVVIAQTPHVSAGGWIDTPAPVNLRKYSGNISTIIEEVPEELTAGIGKDTVSSDTIKVNTSPDSKTVPTPLSQLDAKPDEIEQPKSALASILEQQKNRLLSKDITNISGDDTLKLGNETLESLQDLLALDEEEDITSHSQLSVIDNDTKPLNGIRSEAELLERLNTKLDRMRSNIHDARKGISKLEHQVSQPTAQQLLSDTTCTVCDQQTFKPHVHLDSQYIPYASLHLTLPIPLLFQRRKSNEWLPRPTALGTITLVIWAWYLLETVMCEFYCRPDYTDFYAWPSQPEPEFPFVLPTMLSRWTHLNTLQLGSNITGFFHFVSRVLTAFWRILSMAFGFSDGFVADGPQPSIVQQIVQTATSIAAAASGVDLSMNDDELL